MYDSIASLFHRNFPGIGCKLFNLSEQGSEQKLSNIAQHIGRWSEKDVKSKTSK